MKTFAQWLMDEYNMELPKGQINGEWFDKHSLPMIVSCECCGRTMMLPNAMVDEEDYTYCSDCADA